MKYILIVVFLNGYGPRPAVQFQEFENRERCEASIQILRQLWQNSRDLGNFSGAQCVPK